MSQSFTVAMLKVKNKSSILKYIYSQKRATPLMIAETLNLSRPTVAQILKELVQEEWICQDGYAGSTGGRKANIYAFNGGKKITIGLELLIDRYEIAAIDLYGEIIKYEKVLYPYSNTDEYYQHAADAVNKFIADLAIGQGKVLGVGIALQALVSSDARRIVYGKILNCTGLEITQFSDRIPYKCMFNHDAEALANTEMWEDPEFKNGIFFNIRENLSGAVIINREFLQGGELKSGVFEHMTIDPEGLPCYCGKRGCVNTYCSVSAFLRQEEDIAVFFNALRSGEEEYVKRWQKYLDKLSYVIDNIHMMITSSVILGGTLSKYLIQDDIEKLHELAYKRSAFPSSERYIKISKCANIPLCVGAALPLVQDYLKKME